MVGRPFGRPTFFPIMFKEVDSWRNKTTTLARAGTHGVATLNAHETKTCLPQDFANFPDRGRKCELIDVMFFRLSFRNFSNLTPGERRVGRKKQGGPGRAPELRQAMKIGGSPPSRNKENPECPKAEGSRVNARGTGNEWGGYRGNTQVSQQKT